MSEGRRNGWAVRKCDRLQEVLSCIRPHNNKIHASKKREQGDEQCEHFGNGEEHESDNDGNDA